MRKVEAYEDIEGALHHDEPSCARRNVEIALTLLNRFVNQNHCLDVKQLLEDPKCAEVIDAMRVAGESYLPYVSQERVDLVACPRCGAGYCQCNPRFSLQKPETKTTNGPPPPCKTCGGSGFYESAPGRVRCDDCNPEPF